MARSGLLMKLYKWLLQQPEWPILFLGDRATRKRAARELADTVFLMPKRGRLPD